MKPVILITTSLLVAGTEFSSGAVIFSQNFNSSNTVADYVSATPDSGQFNAISSSGAGVTVGVNSGALTYTRGTANAGSFSRTTDFSPIPTAIIYQFDLTVTNNSSATTTAAVFQVGSGYGTTNSAESNANTYARLGINIGSTDGDFSVRDVTNATSSATFSGMQSFFWVLNNTDTTISYTAPNNSTVSLANDTADLWLGSTKVWNGVAVQSPTQSISDLKFAFTAGTGTISIDNMVITAIPEPAAALLGGLSLLLLLGRRR